MSTRSKSRSDLSAARPPLVGRPHEMATTRPVPTLEPQAWRHGPHLAGRALIQSSQMTVPGRLGRGKSVVCAPSSWLLPSGRGTALLGWLYPGAPEQARLVVFDEDLEAASIAALFGLEERGTEKVTQHPAAMDPRYRGRQGR